MCIFGGNTNQYILAKVKSHVKYFRYCIIPRYIYNYVDMKSIACAEDFLHLFNVLFDIFWYYCTTVLLIIPPNVTINGFILIEIGCLMWIIWQYYSLMLSSLERNSISHIPLISHAHSCPSLGQRWLASTGSNCCMRWGCSKQVSLP